MPSELDDFLKSRKEEAEQKENNEYELNRRKSAFDQLFKECQKKIIDPAMVKILLKVRTGASHGKVLHEKRVYPYCTQRYCIYPGTGNRIYFILAVVGNYDLEKVLISKDYATEVQGLNGMEHKILKKTEEQYDVSAISQELLEKIVVAGMKETAEIKPA